MAFLSFQKKKKDKKINKNKKRLCNDGYRHFSMVLGSVVFLNSMEFGEGEFIYKYVSKTTFHNDMNDDTVILMQMHTQSLSKVGASALR